MNTLQVINRTLLDELVAQAQAAPRRRKNLNVHRSEQEPCNRLFNALEPDSYIPPHCHSAATKDETFIMVRGRMGVATFDGTGRVRETALLAAEGESLAVTIPHGVFHTMVALEPGTIFFEAKAGPYQPLQPQEKAAWAPAEGDPAAPAFRAKLQALFAKR